MTNPAHVQVAPDGTGKEIDAQQLTTNEDGSTQVLRQTVTIGDPNRYANVAAVSINNEVYVKADDLISYQTQILAELKRISFLLGSIGDTSLGDDEQFLDEAY